MHDARNVTAALVAMLCGCVGHSVPPPPPPPAVPLGALALSRPVVPFSSCMTSWILPTTTRVDGLRPGPTRITVTFRHCNVPVTIYDVTVIAGEVTPVALATDCVIDSFVATSLD